MLSKLTKIAHMTELCFEIQTGGNYCQLKQVLVTVNQETDQTRIMQLCFKMLFVQLEKHYCFCVQ